MKPGPLLMLLMMAGLPLPMPACSPTLISPRDALQPPGQAVRFAHIVIAEVVAARAPARSAELEQWRRDKRALAAAQKEEGAREAARARIQAATPRGPHDPLPPPPSSRLPEPAFPIAFALTSELDLFVLETLYGAHQDRLTVPAGGPCGGQPRLGQRVLAFVQPNGITHLMQPKGEGGAIEFDEAFLDQVRACARGDCPQTLP